MAGRYPGGRTRACPRADAHATRLAPPRPGPGSRPGCTAPAGPGRGPAPARSSAPRASSRTSSTARASSPVCGCAGQGAGERAAAPGSPARLATPAALPAVRRAPAGTPVIRPPRRNLRGTQPGRACAHALERGRCRIRWRPGRGQAGRQRAAPHRPCQRALQLRPARPPRCFGRRGLATASGWLRRIRRRRRGAAGPAPAAPGDRRRGGPDPATPPVPACPGARAFVRTTTSSSTGAGGGRRAVASGRISTRNSGAEGGRPILPASAMEPIPSIPRQVVPGPLRRALRVRVRPGVSCRRAAQGKRPGGQA